MLSQISISLCAVMLAVTSPMLHYWEHAGEATGTTTSDCCGDASCPVPPETPDDPEQPGNWQWDCLCFTRVTVPDGPPCDIAELAAKHLPGDQLPATIDAVDLSADQLPVLFFDWPVHFSPLADAGDLCARLGRYLL